MSYSTPGASTALLVIDVQGEYFKEDGPAFLPAARAVLPNILALIEGARAAGALVVYVQHVNRADGSDIGRMNDFAGPDDPRSFVDGTPEVDLVPELRPRAGEVIVRKRRYSAFLNTDLECVLRTREVKTLVICGYMTSYCCETTARDGHGRDYRVIFVSDANEGPDLADPSGEAVPHDRVLEHTLTALGAGFADIADSEEVVSRFATGSASAK